MRSTLEMRRYGKFVTHKYQASRKRKKETLRHHHHFSARGFVFVFFLSSYLPLILLQTLKSVCVCASFSLRLWVFIEARRVTKERKEKSSVCHEMEPKKKKGTRKWPDLLPGILRCERTRQKFCLVRFPYWVIRRPFYVKKYKNFLSAFTSLCSLEIPLCSRDRVEPNRKTPDD